MFPKDFCLSAPFRYRQQVSVNCTPHIRQGYGEQIPENSPTYLICRITTHSYGEQFLEITPPKIRSVYIPVNNQQLLSNDANVEIKLDEKYYDVGKVKKSQIMTSKMVPESVREYIKTNYAYKVDYFINLPGLIIPEFMRGQIVTVNGVKKLRIAPLDNTPLPYPNQTSPYTIVEPMRIADFLD
jgi:hypothetical protein